MNKLIYLYTRSSKRVHIYGDRSSCSQLYKVINNLFSNHFTVNVLHLAEQCSII